MNSQVPLGHDPSGHGGDQFPGVPAPKEYADPSHGMPEPQETNLGEIDPGRVTYEPCHCKIAVDRGKISYHTFAEAEASGRFPVQTTSTGGYPGPAWMGIRIGALDGNTDDYQCRSGDAQ